MLDREWQFEIICVLENGRRRKEESYMRVYKTCIKNTDRSVASRL